MEAAEDKLFGRNAGGSNCSISAVYGNKYIL